jgi:RNA polymerase sigma-70 factor (ECF subfamily)
MNPDTSKKTFEKSYAEHADALFRFAISKVSNKEQAIDIVEDAFVKFWQTLQKEKVDEPRALLYKITRNLIIDWYRKKKSIPVETFEGERTEKHGEIFLDMFAGNLAGVEVSLEARLVIEKIASLEPIYREAIYLRYVEELTPKEISDITGDPTNLISVRINRGLHLLKSKLHIEPDRKKKE